MNYKQDFKKAEQFYENENYVDSLKIVRELLEQKGISREILAKTELLSAKIYFDISLFEKSLKQVISAQKKFTRLKKKKEIAICNKIIGNNYFSINETDKALKFYERSLKSFQNSDDVVNTIRLLNNIAVMYMNLKEYEDSENTFFKALNIIEKTDHKRIVGIINLNIGDLYTEKQDYSKAIYHLKEAEKSAEEIGKQIDLLAVRQSLGEYYYRVEEYEKALANFKDCEEIIDKFEIESAKAENYEKFGKVYTKLKQYKKAHNNFNKSIELLERNSKDGYYNKLAIMTTDYELELNERKKNIKNQQNEKLKQTLKKLKFAEKDLIGRERENTALSLTVTANHELNQPLMIIQGNLELIEELSNSNTELKELFNQIYKLTKIIKKIINNFKI